MPEPNGWYEHPDGRREDVFITITEEADSELVRTMKSPRPVSIAAWFRMARRGRVWWPGKTFTIDLSNEPPPADYGCCAKEPGHEGWCRWVCPECDGTGKCPECWDDCHCDDVIQCELCDGLHACGRCGGTGDMWDE